MVFCVFDGVLLCGFCGWVVRCVHSLTPPSHPLTLPSRPTQPTHPPPHKQEASHAAPRASVTDKERQHAITHTGITEWMMPVLDRQTYPPGTWLVRQGDPLTQVFYIEEGEVELVREAGMLDDDVDIVVWGVDGGDDMGGLGACGRGVVVVGVHAGLPGVFEYVYLCMCA